LRVSEKIEPVLTNEIIYFVKALFKVVLMPPGIFIAVMLVVGIRWFYFAAITGRGQRSAQKGHAARASGMLLLAGMLYLTNLPWVANTSSYWIEDQTKALELDESGHARVGNAQAIVILGGGLRTQALESKVPEVPSWRTLERLTFGARIARESGLPVLVSGGVMPWRVSGSEAAAMQRSLELDFSVKAKWIEDQSLDTRENAKFSAQMLKADGVTKILLVTHASHMPRSQAAFEAEGLIVRAAPTSFASRTPNNVLTWLPSAAAGARIFDNLHEIVGMLWYRLVAWIKTPEVSIAAKPATNKPH
jgi:uncharacterized SAM-binding protein YcdF (DUF218 family)